MKSAVLIIFIFITTNIFAQDWNTIETFTPGQTIKDIYYVNTTTAYAVSALYNGTALNVKKTSDGGETWVEQFTDHTSTSFYNIDSPNDGGDVFIVGAEGTLIHTNDGGENWNTIDVDITDPIWDIFFLDNSIGFITTNNGIIYKTEDGGATWNNINAVMNGIGSVSNICFITESRGFVGGFNYFKETFDGGLTWTDVPGHEPATLEFTFQIQEIKFYDENVGYFSGDQGLLYKTEDGGETWVNKHVEITDFVVESLFSFDFLEDYPEIGFACGYHGLLIRTFDGGDSWELMSSDVDGTNTTDGSIFHTLDFFGNRGLLAGSHGEMLEFEYVPNDISISENLFEGNTVSFYPNPATDFIFVDSKHNGMPYQIFDGLGRLVLAGIIEESVEVSILNEGMYYFLVNDGEKQAVKLVIE